MAAYRRVYDSPHLPADCQAPGSAPKPTLGNRARATFSSSCAVNEAQETGLQRQQCRRGDCGGSSRCTRSRQRTETDQWRSGGITSLSHVISNITHTHTHTRRPQPAVPTTLRRTDRQTDRRTDRRDNRDSRLDTTNDENEVLFRLPPEQLMSAITARNEQRAASANCWSRDYVVSE